MAIINISRKLLNKNVAIAIAPSPFPQQADHLLISSNNGEKHPFISLSTRDTSLILIVLFLASTFFFLFLFSVYIRRFTSPQAIEISRHRRQRQQQHRDQQQASSSSTSQAHGLDILIIQSLPAFAWKEIEEQESIDCSVCLSQFEEKESVTVIPYCGHLFHTECIDTWLLSNVSCPLCRSIQLFPSNKITVECLDVGLRPLDQIQVEARNKLMLTCPPSSPS
ncbi:Ring-h2 finger protein atl57 [Thalictrum thalictroides]|uniref:RING-type E3 ubiquitin transferase n=1 Tax=Thalictrum thalictroides TaxID=46969 RepID=A0A7J6WL53_THATH|nr:Ring-h2 finger protein atl57 [Thalictrum thalictroides]